MQIAKKRIKEWKERNNRMECLDLTGLALSRLPLIPIECEIFNCDNNELSFLPPLLNCKWLSCCHNNLTFLTDLPKCENLYCWDNRLTKLPDLPLCEDLYCQHNKLTYLPKLPKCQSLHCQNKNILILSEIPNCVVLYCHNNEYLNIDSRIAKRFGINETPNYNEAALQIQQVYKKFIKKKYIVKLLDIPVLYKDVASICSNYMI